MYEFFHKLSTQKNSYIKYSSLSKPDTIDLNYHKKILKLYIICIQFHFNSFCISFDISSIYIVLDNSPTCKYYIQLWMNIFRNFDRNLYKLLHYYLTNSSISRASENQMYKIKSLQEDIFGIQFLNQYSTYPYIIHKLNLSIFCNLQGMAHIYHSLINIHHCRQSKLFGLSILSMMEGKVGIHFQKLEQDDCCMKESS